MEEKPFPADPSSVTGGEPPQASQEPGQVSAHNFITASISLAVCILDESGFLDANPAFACLCGYTRQELLVLQPGDLIEPGLQGQFASLVAAWMNSDGKSHRAETCLRTKEGKLIWLDLTIDPAVYDGRPALACAALDISQRKQLELSLRRQADELSVLHSLSVDISAPHEYGDLLARIVERAANLLMADSSGLYICDTTRRSLELVATFNLPDIPIVHTLQYGMGAAGQAAQIASSLIANDYPAWENRIRDYDGYPGFTAVIAVPMLWRDRVLGVLDVMDQSGQRSFTSADQALLERYAAQAAVVLANGQLLADERRLRQQAEALTGATAVMTSSLDVNRVLDLILTHLENVVPFDSASVFLLEGERLRIVASRGFWHGGSMVGHEFPSDDELFGAIRSTKEPLILQDARLNPQFHGWEGTSRVRGWLGVPLIVRDDVIGYVTLDNHEVAAYDQNSARLAAALVNQAATAIHNAHLFEGERMQVLHAKTLQELGALLTSQLGLEDVLERVLDLLGRVLEYDTASIHLIDPGGRFYMAAGRGFADLALARAVVQELSEHIFSHDWQANRVIVFSDVNEEPSWRPHPSFDRVRSWVGAPLLVKGRFIGSLNVDSYTPRAYNSHTGETVMAFANQAAIAIENTRLFEAEHAARARAEALRDAARVVGSTLSLDEVLQAVLDQLSGVLQFDSGNVMLQDQADLKLKAWRGYERFVDPGLIQNFKIAIDKAFWIAEVLRTSKVQSVRNVKHDALWVNLEATEHIGSWLGIPILIRGECRGLLSLDRVSPDGFSDEESALAQTFALHVSTAIENAWLYEAQEQRTAELEAIRQASLNLTASLDLPDLLNSILTHVLTLMPGATDAHVFLYYPESDRLAFGAALWSSGLRGATHAQPRSDGLTYTVARSGEAVVVSDRRTHPLFDMSVGDTMGAVVGLPLKIGSRVVGVMNIAYQEARRFQENELRLLRLLGDQAAIAIENARLFEQAEAEQRHLGLLYEISRDLSSSLNPAEILERAIALTCQALDGLVGQVHTYLPDEDSLVLSAIVGRTNVTIEEINSRVRLKTGQGLLGWAAKYARSEIVSDVLRDERWNFVSGVDDDVRSAICAPIMNGDNLVGVLSVYHQQPAAFTLEHLKLLQAICQEVGLALSNATSYQEVQRRLKEILLIQSLAQTFNQRLELQELLNEVVARLVDRFGYPQVEIFLVEGNVLVQRAYQGTDPLKNALSLQSGVVGRVARTGEAILVTDVQADPDYILCVADTVAELAVPIIHETLVVGVINIETHVPGQLTSQDRDLLQLLAGQISIALENSVLYERVRQHAVDLELIVEERTAELVELYELSQRIGYALSYHDIFQLLLSHLLKAVKSDLVAGGMFDGPVSSVFVDSVRPLSRQAVDELKIAWMTAQQDYRPGMEVREPGNFDFQVTDALRFAGPSVARIGTGLRVPLVVDGEMAGLLIAAFETDNVFSTDQVRILNTFANQAAVALQRLRALLAAEQKRLESLVEHLPLGVLLLDDEYHLVLANPLGRDLLASLNGPGHPGPLAFLGPQPVSELVGEHLARLPVDIHTSGEPNRIIEAQASSAGRAADRWVITLRDVTQERETRSRIQMQERLATVGQLAAGIAHDFNNIMAAILVYAELLIDDPALPSVSRERLAIIQQQVERAASLIRQILDFSRRSVMEQSHLDLLPFIKELDKMLRRVLPETIQIELAYSPGEYAVNADPTRLQQALMNLALNARDAMPRGGTLRFGLRRKTFAADAPRPFKDMADGNYICLSVEDNGMGIPAANLPHMFEPFFTTKPVGQGTGLGLAQVYGIIKQHDGYIDIQSEEGEGSLFTIYLPAVQVTAKQAGQVSPFVHVNGTGRTVLVVEDDPATREALQALLEAHNYRVITAANGLEALDYLNNPDAGLVDLVISDVVMPRMGGVDLYRAVQGRWPQTKFLFVTGHPLEGANQALLEAGAVHWLQKPFSVQDFRQAVHLLMDEPDRRLG